MKTVFLASVMSLVCCMAVLRHLDAQAQDGDLLYRAKCTACHRVYQPKNYTYQTLQAHVATYGRALSDEERRNLLGYLKENAKQAREKGGKDGQ